MAENNTIEDLKAPLLAAVGAADLALNTVNEIVATLVERAGEAREDASARVEEGRARLTKISEDLPVQVGELRDKLTADELRKVAEAYSESATATYVKLVARGEVALEKLRGLQAVEAAAGRVELVSGQAAKLVGKAEGLVGKAEAKAESLVGKTAPVKKAAATKAAPAKKAPAKKAAPVKKAAATKAAPAKKAPAKKVTQK